MNKKTLFGEEYSYLIPLLLFKNAEGRVHSCFSNGFNIQMVDSLIFIGNNKNGLLPFGIHLKEEDTYRAVSSVKNGDDVKWNSHSNCIEFLNFSISIDGSQSFKNEITPLKSETFDRSFEQYCFYLRLLNVRTGLDISPYGFLQKLQSSNKEMHKAESYLILLIKAAIIDDDILIDKVLKYFLGRGQGLTPSGDDMIVGFLAFDAISHFLSEKFYGKIAKKIEGESITTDIAKEYIRYALKREYSSTVTDLINSIACGNDRLKESFRNLLGVGHSSGLDTILGILIGMLTFKNKKILSQ